MKPDIQSHLTDEALDDVLIGLGSLASHAHLAQCARCRARVEEFQSSVDLFNLASRAYSESRPRPPLTTKRPAPRFQPVFAAWAAAAVLLALGGPAAWHVFAPHPVKAPVATATQDTQNQIAEDNELLKQVNAAIAPDEQSVVDQYHLLEGSGPQARSRVRTE